MPQTLTDVILETAQECLKSMPVIVLGSGASVPFGLPSMEALAHHLINTPPDAQSQMSVDEGWSQFVDNIAGGMDLETALQEIGRNDAISDHIVRVTWEYVSETDVQAFDEIVSNDRLVPLARLFRYLFTSTHATITVVTTNYDRLAEYAADVAGTPNNVGFAPGYMRRRITGSQLQYLLNGQVARTVNVWKVHGCLDWFLDQDGNVKAFAASRSIPDGLSPAIVTPGIEKYERTHQEPFRSIIQQADDALSSSNAFLCIGFGFNDQHIQPRLTERWDQGETLLVILAKSLTDSAKQILDRAQGKRYLAMEESCSGTLVRSHHFPDPCEIQGVKWWDLSTLLDATT